MEEMENCCVIQRWSIVALEGWFVKRVTRKNITEFIETNHYSGSINGCIADYCYALFSPDGIIKGAMFYGRMAMANQWKRFATTETDVIELRRLCCVDDTPRNTESYFISRSLKMLKEEWKGSVVVSYADMEYGHVGTIYKASNFKCLGSQSGARIIMYEGRRYHDKTIRTKYNGELKPFALKIKQALETGEAVYKKTAGKVTYVYQLRKQPKGEAKC